MSAAETTPQPEIAASPLSGEAVFALVALVMVAIGAAMTLLFGLPGLVMTALALVPVLFVLLIVISVGK